MNDLQVVVQQEIGKITFNFEEMKQLALEETKKYSGLVLTEDDVAPAKKDRAELNHKFEDLESRRKEIEKTYMAPLNDFKVQIKEIGKIITNASETIDKQIKVFEEAEKVKKKVEIQKIYDAAIGELEKYLPFSKIYDAKWENKDATIKRIKEAIESLVSSTELAVGTIKGMNSEATEQALKQYENDLSLTNAITYINRYEAQKAEILAKEEARRKAEEDQKAEAERERIRSEERQKIAEIERAVSGVKSGSVFARVPKVEPVLAADDYEEDLVPIERPFIPGKTWTTYEILCNKSDIEIVDAQLDMFGIKFRRL